MLNVSDAEWKVLTVLWDESPLTLMEITRRLEPETGWKKTTVMTFLRRMIDKGTITYIERNRTKYFYPAYDQTNAEYEEAKSFLNKVYHGKMGLMLSAFLQHEELSDAEIDELYDILKRGNRKE